MIKAKEESEVGRGKKRRSDEIETVNKGSPKVQSLLPDINKAMNQIYKRKECQGSEEGTKVKK